MSTAVATRLFDNIIEFPRPAQEGGKSNEWYTPARYIEAAREVMGSIDLDPASCEQANQTVKATRYYTKEDNGLVQPWYGRVWLNPPYSTLTSTKGLTGGKQEGPTIYFVDKLLRAYRQWEIEQAIICLNADICRKWFQPLWDFPICFSSKPISFNRPGREPEHHFFSTAFIYLGSNFEKFIEVFSKFGRIARAIDTPRQIVRPLSLWEEVAP